MSRVALVVGVNQYQHLPELFGCSNDAKSVRERLETHWDDERNFECNAALVGVPDPSLDRHTLREALIRTFSAEAEVALFYFAGHGHVSNTGGVILTAEARNESDGMSLHDVVSIANQSNAINRVVILDSCHAGVAANLPGPNQPALIHQGVTILAASTDGQYANERDGHGVFSELLVDALDGGGATLTGQVTPGGIYAHIDQSLPAVGQRPVFKTNVQRFVSLRKVRPSISRGTLIRLYELFAKCRDVFRLDPEHEPEFKGRDPEMPLPVPEKIEQFLVLQAGNRVNLVVPVDQPNMWSAAMKSGSCQLTPLGRHYWRLAKDRLI